MTGKLVRIYDEHSEQVNCCHFTNNSNHLLLATGSNDYFLKVSVNENHVDKFDRYIRTSPLIFFFIYCVNQRSFGYRYRNFCISLSNNSKLALETGKYGRSLSSGIADSRCLNYILRPSNSSCISGSHFPLC